MDERFVESLSACLEEIDSAAVAAAAAAGAGVGGIGPGARVEGGARGSNEKLSSMMSGLVVLVGSTESLESLPTSLRRCFTHEVGGYAVGSGGLEV